MAYDRNYEITVYRKRDYYGLKVPIEIALRLGLEDGQTVTDEEYAEILKEMGKR